MSARVLPSRARGDLRAHRLALATVLAIVAAMTFAAGAASGSELSVSADRTAFVQSNAAGDTTAVWSERAAGRVAIRSASRPTGGTWSAPETIATARAATLARATEPLPMALAVAPDGGAHLLWGSIQKDNRAPHALFVASRARDGRWTEQRIATARRKRFVGPSADLGATADGTVLVLWGRTTAVPSDFPPDKPAPGSVWVTERATGGAWQAPRKLGRAGSVDPGPQLAVNRSGAAAALWSQSGSNHVDEVPMAYSMRGAQGGWSAGNPAYKLRGPGPGGVEPPLLDEAGRLHVLSQQYGNYGVSGFAHRIVGPQVPVAKAVPVPNPTPDQTQKGYLGSGYVFSSGAALAADGQLVVVAGHQAPDVENGAFGIGAIWAATRAGTGQWAVSALDGLAETTAAMNVDVSTNAAGAVVATWTADVGTPPACSSVVFGSVRAGDGTWSPRKVISTADAGPVLSYDPPINSGPCYPVIARRTGGADPVYWWLSDGHLVVEHAAAEAMDPASVAPVVEQLTTTWQQVRRAGGLQLRCSTPLAGYCSASIVTALEQASAAATPSGAGIEQVNQPLRALGCFALRGTSTISADPAGQVVTLPVDAGCRHGWVPPTISFDVLVATDAPGHTPATSHRSVTITR